MAAGEQSSSTVSKNAGGVVKGILKNSSFFLSLRRMGQSVINRATPFSFGFQSTPIQQVGQLQLGE